MENPFATSLTDAARLVQLIKVDGYCTTQSRLNNSFEVKSRWHVDGYEWEIGIYPDYGSWVALDLVFLSGSRNGKYVRANLGCRLVDPRGILQPSEEKNLLRLFCSSESYSSDELLLVKRQDLDRSGYLRDDALTLQCTITVLKELPVQSFPVKEIPMPAVPSSNLHTHFGDLLQSEKGVDVTFLVSGESIVAHKAVLAARSPVFMAEFFGQMVEKSSGQVEIKDMDAAVFKELLRFVYTDTAPEFGGQQKEAATVMAQHLMAAADRYGLDRLKLICEGRLARGIDVETAAATLALAEQHGCEQLKARCIEFIVRAPEVLDAVMATEGYRHVEASCPSVLTDLLAHGTKKPKRARS